MKRTTLLITGLLTSFGLGFYINTIITKQPETNIKQSNINTNT